MPKKTKVRDAEEHTNREPRQEPPRGGKKKKFLIGVTALVMLFAAAAAFLWVGDGWTAFFPAAAAGKKQDQEGPRYLFDLKEFQVNLADGGARRYLRVKMVAGYDARALQKECTQRESELRSAMITLLRSKTVADLDGPEGMKQLQEDLLTCLNRILTAGKLTDIYFIDFIIQ